MSATSKYAEIYGAWQKDPQAFWEQAAADIDWFKPADKVFDPDMDIYGRWYVGATCNTCYNAVDRHVDNGRAEQPALIHESAYSGKKTIWTYAQLRDEVRALAATYRDLGISKGDRVLIYMPMVPEAVAAMLASARLGAIHTVVFGGFAASELATRINDCEPKLIVAASCGVEPNRIVEYKPLVDKAIDISDHKPAHCLYLQRDEHICDLSAERDLDYNELVSAHREAKTPIPCEEVAATDPLYILYTSGTTGQPKGVVRDNGGHMVAMKWSMEAVYGIKPGEVFWAASDVGWVVGHSYICYAPLLHGATTLMFEGKPVGTPDAGAFWRVIQDYKVAALFTAPTAIRAVKKEDSRGAHIGNYDISSLRTLFLAGERADSDTIEWAAKALNVPVIDHWWQTETGWAMVSNPIGLGALPLKIGSPTVAMPGYDIRVLDDAGHEVAAGTLGNIAVKLPLPPGCMPSLWNAEQRFREAYLNEFSGYYKTSDAGYMDEDGYLFIMARTDDIINVAGHRLSTGAMEEIIGRHPDVAECAVIGIADPLKGQVPVGFLITNTGTERSDSEIEADVIQMVRDEIGPVAAFKTALTVPRLPKTRSGKILRATIQKIADGEAWKMPATIEDPSVLEEITEILEKRKIGSFD
ncbi:propionyl-CoA synthetase [Ahrensia marina]|uniref:Propionyl-CoA synthetase n=1 Tax=Ahrensia marina TaxID=1514904 RepID=A0A0M9GNY2_9HYPH|nr:propionyl-CoA synthetase [Ahrensia marina]KPB02357.1 propionyl-CoA synthetase [Ahrensia marina]